MSRLIARLFGPLVMLTLGCTPHGQDADVRVESDRYEFKGEDAAVDEVETDRAAEDKSDLADAGSVFDRGRAPVVVDAAVPSAVEEAGSKQESGSDAGNQEEDGEEDPGEPAGEDDDDELDAGEAGDARVNEQPPGEPDAGDDAPGQPATFSRVYEIFRQQCRGCHQGGSQFSLDLGTQASAYAELVGGPKMGAAEFITCADQGYFRVVPGQPNQSLLIWKLEGVQPCGDRMPPGKGLSASLVKEVSSWIEAGALDN